MDSAVAQRVPNEQDLYVDTPDALATLAERLNDTPWLAVDTEFLREKTYRARLCLIQIAAPGIVACIDPLALPDLDPLRPLFRAPGVVKVLHAARQDLEILYQLWDEIPAPVFDTQIAAALLGHGEQIGYGRLVAETLDVTLEKGHARTDWSQRPLDPAQIHYAADDVRYLGELYAMQHSALVARGRLSWLDDDFRRLGEPATYVTDPEDAWRRLKGVNHLQGVQLSIARALAAWRERQAMDSDRPRRWILADEPLLDIARRAPASRPALQQIRGLPETVVARHGEALLEIVALAVARPESEWPALDERLVLTPEQEALSDLLMAALRLEAGRQDIAPALLATRRELERLAGGDHDLPVMQGWRAHVVGHTLRAVIEGRLIVRISQGQASLVPA
ncbi:ribonuclease D [Acidihalobacter prosperus]|uniref:Ribonuclease D n=1 Tax=Acidihalobacter prosperus TaxID=160660 RepID=A0A1A6C0F0_9GAMM|nr:ribonuclease D [Acidihalobacter prosperus]OBS08037.1 ribonuclease D [Acidihalobacter prosperus]